jgi:hypothetical protein
VVGRCCHRRGRVDIFRMLEGAVDVGTRIHTRV